MSSGGGASDAQAVDCNEIQKTCQCGGTIPSTLSTASPKGKGTKGRTPGRPGVQGGYASSYFG